MNIINNNPFRVLGIPVNAGAKDLAANKGKMKLLDIGKEVSFTLDLTTIMPPIVRSKESVNAAERDINLPQGKIRHALFWLAKPTDTIGKFGYERLLSGDLNDAIDKLSKSTSWEAKLCLSTLLLLKENFSEALSAIASVIDSHCDEFIKSVAGDTYSTDTDTIMHECLSTLSSEIDITDLYLNVYSSFLDSQNPPRIIAMLSDMAVDIPIANIEKEISNARSVHPKNASAQLEAGRTLKTNTSGILSQLRRFINIKDARYSRIADKLANQILQCSINYFNAYDEESRTIIDNALDLGECALKIARGKIARDHIQHNVDILRKKKAELPPIEVEQEDNSIKLQFVIFAMADKKINDAIQLMHNCAPFIVSLKEKLNSQEIINYYHKISTLIVNTALNVVIDEHNRISKEVNESTSQISDKIERLKTMYREAWQAMLMMDKFDKEPDFEEGRFKENKQAIQDIIIRFGGRFRDENDIFGLPDIEIINGYPVKTDRLILEKKISSEIFDLRTDDELFKDCTTKYACELYFKRFPNGKHTQCVKKKHEAYFAKDCISVNDCKNYLKQYPNGLHRKEIEDKLDNLIFNHCKTKADFEKYLIDFPNGIHRNTAQNRINEAKDFNSCVTIDDYQSFIERYPKGFFKNDALNKIDDLTFNSCSTKREYRKYLEKYPNGRHKNEAQRKINGSSGSGDGPSGCLIATILIGLIGGIALAAAAESFWAFVIVNVFVWSAYLRSM